MEQNFYFWNKSFTFGTKLLLLEQNCVEVQRLGKARERDREREKQIYRKIERARESVKKEREIQSEMTDKVSKRNSFAVQRLGKASERDREREADLLRDRKI